MNGIHYCSIFFPILQDALNDVTRYPRPKSVFHVMVLPQLHQHNQFQNGARCCKLGRAIWEVLFGPESRIRFCKCLIPSNWYRKYQAYCSQERNIQVTTKVSRLEVVYLGIFVDGINFFSLKNIKHKVSNLGAIIPNPRSESKQDRNHPICTQLNTPLSWLWMRRCESQLISSGVISFTSPSQKYGDELSPF